MIDTLDKSVSEEEYNAFLKVYQRIEELVYDRWPLYSKVKGSGYTKTGYQAFRPDYWEISSEGGFIGLIDKHHYGDDEATISMPASILWDFEGALNKTREDILAAQRAELAWQRAEEERSRKAKDDWDKKEYRRLKEKFGQE